MKMISFNSDQKIIEIFNLLFKIFYHLNIHNETNTTNRVIFPIVKLKISVIISKMFK